MQTEETLIVTEGNTWFHSGLPEMKRRWPSPAGLPSPSTCKSAACSEGLLAVNSAFPLGPGEKGGYREPQAVAGALPGSGPASHLRVSCSGGLFCGAAPFNSSHFLGTAVEDATPQGDLPRSHLPLLRLCPHATFYLWQWAQKLRESIHMPSKGPSKQARPSDLMWSPAGGTEPASLQWPHLHFVLRPHPSRPLSTVVLLCPSETVITLVRATRPPTLANKKGGGLTNRRRNGQRHFQQLSLSLSCRPRRASGNTHRHCTCLVGWHTGWPLGMAVSVYQSLQSVPIPRPCNLLLQMCPHHGQCTHAHGSCLSVQCHSHWMAAEFTENPTENARQNLNKPLEKMLHCV